MPSIFCVPRCLVANTFPSHNIALHHWTLEGREESNSRRSNIEAKRDRRNSDQTGISEAEVQQELHIAKMYGTKSKQTKGKKGFWRGPRGKQVLLTPGSGYGLDQSPCRLYGERKG